MTLDDDWKLADLMLADEEGENFDFDDDDIPDPEPPSADDPWWCGSRSDW